MWIFIFPQLWTLVGTILIFMLVLLVLAVIAFDRLMIWLYSFVFSNTDTSTCDPHRDICY
jgi:hypothetical protein